MVDDSIVQANRNLSSDRELQWRTQRLSQSLHAVRSGSLERARSAVDSERLGETIIRERRAFEMSAWLAAKSELSAVVDQIDVILSEHDQYHSERSLVKQVESILNRQVDLRRSLQKVALSRLNSSSQELLFEMSRKQLEVARLTENAIDVNRTAASFYRIPLEMREAATLMRRSDVDAALSSQQEIILRLEHWIGELVNHSSVVSQNEFDSSPIHRQDEGLVTNRAKKDGLVLIHELQTELNSDTKKLWPTESTKYRHSAKSKSLAIRQQQIAERLRDWYEASTNDVTPNADENDSAEEQKMADSLNGLELLFEGLSTSETNSAKTSGREPVDGLLLQMSEVADAFSGNSAEKYSRSWVVDKQAMILRELNRMIENTPQFVQSSERDLQPSDQQHHGARPQSEGRPQQNKAADASGEQPPVLSMDRAWGHLPHRIRSQLPSIRGDNIHPKYKQQIRRYYENLAKP